MNITKRQILEFIKDLIIEPRRKAIKWSKITKQTASLKIGYPGQHIASLVTGVEGEKTGARGNDLSDGSEVKSCSRVDPLDVCLECRGPVLRQETKCGSCNSDNIHRTNDSKWLFGIRNEGDLNLLLKDPHLNRIILIIDDYPRFFEKDYSVIRIQVFEIWPKKKRHSQFGKILTNYYNNIYLAHKKLYPNKNPAPKNFWPYSYQFYLCNPLKIFEATIVDAYTEKSEPKIINWIEPKINRDEIESAIMPPEVLKRDEIKTLLTKALPKELERNLAKNVTLEKLKKAWIDKADTHALHKMFRGIDESLRNYLDLRDTDKISVSRKKYSRRSS